MNAYCLNDYNEGVALCESLIEFGGLGHSAVIHAEDQEIIKHIILINGILKNTSVELINKNINSVAHMKVENFTLKASDLEANGFLDKTQYNKLLAQAKEIYINKDGYVSNEYIIEELKKMNSK